MRGLSPCMLMLILSTPLGLAQLPSDNSTTFDHVLFSSTIPQVMRMGTSYSVSILVKNNGATPKRLRAVIYSPGRFIYPDYDSQMFTIGARNTYLAHFELTPIRSHIGTMNITVYLIEGESPEYLPTDFTMLDNATVYVRRIDPLLSKSQKALLTVILILSAAFASYLLYRRV